MNMNIHTSSKKYELTFLYELRASYPRRSGLVGVVTV